MYSYAPEKRNILKSLTAFKYYHIDIPLKYQISKRKTSNNRFSCGLTEYKYDTRKKNDVRYSERTVELPIAIKYVNDCKGSILEVGNVLNQYYHFPHTVVDKYEISQGVINTDIVDFVPNTKYDLVISISTLEHVGFDEEEQDSTKILKSLDKLFSATKDGGTILISVPLGHNPHLDIYLKNGIIKAPDMHLLKRTSYKNEWIEQSLDLLNTEKFVYGSPYPYANYVLVMMWTKIKGM